MMKFIERLDQHMGAKTWVANPAARSPTGSSQYPPREALSRNPSVSNLHSLRRQPSVDDQRKLKEQRLAELARQLELTQLQHTPSRAKPAPQAPSRPLSPLSNLPPEPHYPPMGDVDLGWQERQRKVDEINHRIEFLKASGLPSDRIPSPVHLPSRSVSQARMDRGHLNSSLPHDYHAPAPSSPPFDHGLRHQPSKRSLNSLRSSHPMKSPPSMAFQQNHTLNKDRSPSSSQVGYYQALKEAESLIDKLRSSHDDLLERVNGLENKLKLKEDENRDLTTRNQRLEAFLTEEQRIKEEFQIENERLMNQLKSFSFSSQTSSSGQNPQSHFQPPKSHQEKTFDTPLSRSGSMQHDINSVRAELLKREENLQRQYAYNYSVPTIRPEPIQPSSYLRSQISPQFEPAPKSNLSERASAKTSAFRVPSNSQAHTNRDLDSAHEQSHLAKENNQKSNINATSANHPRDFGSNGLDDLLGPSHYQREPAFTHGQFSNNNPHLPVSNDQLPLPPFMNDELAWNYPHPPGGLRPQAFPAYGLY